MKKTLSFLLTTILTFTLSFSQIATAAEGKGSPRFALKQASENNISADGKSFDFGVIKKGTVLEGSAKIHLIDDVPSTFSIALGSATAFDGMDNIDNWLTVKNRIIKVAGKTSKRSTDSTFDFSIQTPQDLLPGEYSLRLQAAMDDYEGFVQDPGSSRVRLVYSIKIDFAIEGDRVYDMEFTTSNYNTELLDKENSLNLNLGYTNKGNAKLYPHITLNLKSSSGFEFTENYEAATCNSGSNCAFSINENELALALPDKVDMSVDLSYTKKFDGSEKIPFGKATFTHYIIPWLYIFIGTGTIAFLLLIFFFISGRRKRLISNSKEYTVKEGDDLQKVANKFGADSKKIIIANKLKSPFFLTPGSSIYIPKPKNKK